MSITLELDEDSLRMLPLGPGERERHMQIELACRYYARRWLTFGQAARMAGLDHFAFAVELVSNTSPISNLAIIGRLTLLRHRYGYVTVPEAVAGELRALSHVAAQERISAAFRDGWLLV
jgi:predicted HTH domain antitoxin